MRGVVLLVVGILIGAVIGWWCTKYYLKTPAVNVNNEKIVSDKLSKYTIDSLGKRNYGSEVVWDEITATSSAYGESFGFSVRKFHFISEGKAVSGLSHIPDVCTSKRKCPVIVQFRGYASPENYVSGYGTIRSAQKYAQSGFVTLAPDFLGYGFSDEPEEDVFEARFETYTTALNLLASVESLEMVESNKVGIWGHSNGGQIALTVLEISKKDYPTVLWAPVTAPFPYSIIYYMDDNSEGDRELRRKLVEFEGNYNADEFNLLNYLERVAATIQIHQGTADELVPRKWSDSFVKKLIDLNKNVEYFVYPGGNHNLTPGWDTVVSRDLVFFKEKLGLTDN